MSGTRVGEVLGLKWADLDETLSTLRLRRAVTQEGPARCQQQRVRQAKWRLKIGDLYGADDAPSDAKNRPSAAA